MTTVQHARTQRPSMPTWKLWLIRIILLALIGGAIYVWPEGVAVVVAGMVIVVVAVVWWIKRKIRSIVEPFKELANIDLFSGTIELAPRAAIDWHHAEQMEAISTGVEACGFERVGDFSIESSAGMSLRAWLHRGESIYAAAYDVEYGDSHLDYVIAFTDGSYVTYSTTSIPSGLERPPTMPLERLPGLSPIELLQKLREGAPGKPRRSVTAEGFVPCVKEYVAQEAAWRQQQFEREEKLQQDLEEAFLDASGWSAIQWDREQDRVVFIRDDLKSDDVVDAYRRGIGHLEENAYDREVERAERIAKRTAPRQAFTELMDTTTQSAKFAKLAEVTAPMPADVYLAPKNE